MATSGTYTYSITAANLILSSLRLVNAYDPEFASSATTAQQANAAEALEMMLKGWQTQGLQLWERKYGAIFFQKNQAAYILGGPGPGGDHASISSPMGGGFIATTIPNGASTSDATITVESVDSSYDSVGSPAATISNGYYIGFELSDGTMQWTTVNGAPAGLVVTLTTPVSATVDAGAVCYCYQTKLHRPIMILDCFIRQVAGNDVPVNLISRDDYNTFGKKASYGTPNQLYYDSQRDAAHLYFYPAPNDVTQTAFIEFQSPVQDVGTTSNTLDLPQEWVEALKYNLAVRIAPEYGISLQRYKQIRELADYTFDRLNSWDQEQVSVSFQPSQWNYK